MIDVEDYVSGGNRICKATGIVSEKRGSCNIGSHSHQPCGVLEKKIYQVSSYLKITIIGRLFN